MRTMTEAMRVRLARTIVRTPINNDWLVRFAARGTDAQLDRQLAAILELARVARVPKLEMMTPTEAREFADNGLADTDLPAAPMVDVIDTTVGDASIGV